MLKRGLEIFPKMVPAMSKNTENVNAFQVLFLSFQAYSKSE